MRNRSRLARGFTLIELMVVVAIIGVLSSIAIPSFRNMQLRSRQAERNIMFTSIHRAIDDYWMRENKYPYDFGGGMSLLYLYQYNPDNNPGPEKRPWRKTALNWLDHWNRLSLMVDGSVYFTYYGYAYDLGSTRYTYLFVDGDLDGDRVRNTIERIWYYQNNQLLKWGGGTSTCWDCTLELETPWPRTTF